MGRIGNTIHLEGNGGKQAALRRISRGVWHVELFDNSTKPRILSAGSERKARRLARPFLKG